MIPARLQYGPYDGNNGHVKVPPPLALDVTDCRGCGCGKRVHYRVAGIDEISMPGYHRYELIEIGRPLSKNAGVALYRHSDTLDPSVERAIMESLRA